MKLLLKYIINTIGFVSGIITIVAVFVKPEEIGQFLHKNIKFSLIFDLVTKYSKFVIVIPFASGFSSSSRYGGFSFPRFIYDPLHLLSSFVMFEFWIGFGTGIKYIGYFVIPILLLILLKAIVL